MPVTPQESMVSQQFLIGVESSYGVAVSTNKRVRSWKAPFAPQYETERFTPSGSLIPSVNILNDAFTMVDATGKPDYNAMIYPLASVFGVQSIANPTATVYEHTFGWNGLTPTSPVSYTAMYGQGALARQATGLVWTKYNLSVSRSGGLDFGASAFAKEATFGNAVYPRNEKQTISIGGTVAPTGGTFTLTFGGNTTSTIAWNAANSAVQSALVALASIGAGNVTVTGGPGPNTPWVVEFTGTLANTDTALITGNAASLTGGTGNVITVVETQKGDSVTDIDPVIMTPLQYDVYLDTSWANLGTTKLLGCYKFELTAPDRFQRTRPINSTQSSDGIVEPEDQEFGIKATLLADATAEAQIATLKAGGLAFLRLEAKGAVIASTYQYRFRQDMAIFPTEVDAYQAEDGVHVLPISGVIGRDQTSNKAVEVKVQNKMATL